MSEQSGKKSPFDKNLRSLLEAMSMFEKEAVVLLDRFGVDGEMLRRGLYAAGMLSGDVVRQISASLGLADAKTVDAVSRDLRSLLERVARLREKQKDAGMRLDQQRGELERSTARLDGALEAMARVQGRTQVRLDRLEERSLALESRLGLRDGQSERIATMLERIEKVESQVAALAGQLRGGKAAARTPGSGPRRVPARPSDGSGSVREDRPEAITAQPGTR